MCCNSPHSVLTSRFQETLSTISTGGTLVLLDEWVRRDTAALTELLKSQAIEREFSFRHLCSKPWPSTGRQQETPQSIYGT